MRRKLESLEEIEAFEKAFMEILNTPPLDHSLYSTPEPSQSVTFTLPKLGQGNTYKFTRLSIAFPTDLRDMPWSTEYIVPGYTPGVPEADILPTPVVAAIAPASLEPFRFVPISERSCAGSVRVAGGPAEARRCLIRTSVRWPKCPKHGCDLVIEGVGSTPYTESLLRCPDCYVYDPNY